MKKIFLATLLTLSVIDNQCSERASQIFNYITPYAKTLAIGSLAALKIGYNHIPSLTQLTNMAMSAYYSTMVLQFIKPHWFPGTQLGIKDPELTRVEPDTLKTEKFQNAFFDQWTPIKNIIASIQKYKKSNDADTNNRHYYAAVGTTRKIEQENVASVEKNKAFNRWTFNTPYFRQFISFLERRDSNVKSASVNKEFTPSLEPGKYVYVLQGPPGCGKSSLPRYLAKQSNCPLYSITGTDLATGHDGATATNFKNIIKAAYQAAYNVENKLAIVVMDDIDTLFKGSSQEVSLMKSYILGLVDEMQQNDQRIQKKEKAEVLLFFSQNYNKNEWLDQGALTRAGRAIHLDFKKMENNSSMLLEKIKAAWRFASTGNEENICKILSSSEISLSKDDFHSLLYCNDQVIQSAIKKYNISEEDYFKQMFKAHFPNLDPQITKKENSFELFFNPMKYEKAVQLLTYKELECLNEISANHQLGTQFFYKQLFEYLNNKNI